MTHSVYPEQMLEALSHPKEFFLSFNSLLTKINKQNIFIKKFEKLFGMLELKSNILVTM